MSVIEKATELNRLRRIKFPKTDEQGGMTIDKVVNEYKKNISIILDVVLWKIWGIQGKEVIGYKGNEIFIDPIRLENSIDKSIEFYEEELGLENIRECAICGTLSRIYYLCDHCDTAETGPVCADCVDWERFDDSYFCKACPDRSDVKWAKKTIDGLSASNGYLCNRKVVKLIMDEYGGSIVKWGTKYWIQFEPAYRAYSDFVYKEKNCTRDDYRVWINQASMYKKCREWK